jgi:hypothetical protein
MYIIGTNDYGQKKYRIFLHTGLAWMEEFIVYAYNETEAIDEVADYCEENELHGLYADYYELFDICDVGQTVAEYAEANNITCCGNHGIYIRVESIELIEEEMQNA